MSSTYTLEQYQRLTAALAEGVLSVQYADKRQVYRSLDEMLLLKRTMEADLGLNGPGRGPLRLIRAQTGKGV